MLGEFSLFNLCNLQRVIKYRENQPSLAMIRKFIYKSTKVGQELQLIFMRDFVYAELRTGPRLRMI